MFPSEPNHPLARFNLGALEEMEGRERLAAAHYAAAVAAQPDLFEAQLLLANSLLRSRRFAAAAVHYDAALRLRPERSELLLKRAVAEQAGGDCAQAVSSLLQLVRRLPEDFEALLAYSRCVTSCPAARAVDRQNAHTASRNLYRLSPAVALEVTLAIAAVSGGDSRAKVEYQTQD